MGSTYQVKDDDNNDVRKESLIQGTFDVALANKLAKVESYNKHNYRPNTYLHKWWARRCGTTFRTILKYLVSDEHSRDYYSPGGLEGKIILDPMLGGGTTLHEAIRMGANVIGCDIDPIPVAQARASLSDMSLLRLEDGFNHFFESLYARISPLFNTSCPHCARETQIQYTLYGVRKKCNCGDAIIMDSNILRHEADERTIQICSQCHEIRNVDETSINSNCKCIKTKDQQTIYEKEVKLCPHCNSPFVENVDVPFHRRYVPLVVVGKCIEHGQFFKRPARSDMDNIDAADNIRDGLAFGAEEFAILSGAKSNDLLRRGINNYLDLFSSRQLIYLKEAIDILLESDPVLRLNLALLVSTSLEFNSMLCGYKGADKRRPGAVRHTFSHHAYSFPYTALENNPVFPSKASGSLQSLFNSRLRKARQWARRPIERKIENDKVTPVYIEGERDIGTEVKKQELLNQGKRRFLLIQGSSESLALNADSVDYIVTDPPYFDSVQYGDLARFFHVWLNQIVPTEADWYYDQSRCAINPEQSGSNQYEDILIQIYKECHRVLRKSDGKFIFTYHHWNARGWSSLTVSLKNAGFELLDYHVVYSENPTSVHIANMNSLTHDAVLILAPVEQCIKKKWDLPLKVNKTESSAFCSDCAAILGWCLKSNLNHEGINKLWSTALGI